MIIVRIITLSACWWLISSTLRELTTMMVAPWSSMKVAVNCCDMTRA